jgi:hypothetical protein
LEKQLQLIRYGTILGLISGAFGVTGSNTEVMILCFFSFAMLGDETGADPSTEYIWQKLCLLRKFWGKGNMRLTCVMASRKKSRVQTTLKDPSFQSTPTAFPVIGTSNPARIDGPPYADETLQ